MIKASAKVQPMGVAYSVKIMGECKAKHELNTNYYKDIDEIETLLDEYGFILVSAMQSSCTEIYIYHLFE